MTKKKSVRKGALCIKIGIIQCGWGRLNQALLDEGYKLRRRRIGFP